MKQISEQQLQLGEINVRVQRKPVRNLTLRISREGQAVVSAPLAAPDSAVRFFLQKNEGWLRSHLAKVLLKLRHNPDCGFDGAHLWLWGRCLQAEFCADAARAGQVLLGGGRAVFFCRRQPDAGGREKLVQELCRQMLRKKADELFAVWQERLGLYAAGWQIRNMKSRWGTCNVLKRTILINLRLAYRPAACLEYVIVHELAHLQEQGHGPGFRAFLDRHMADWRGRKALLDNYIFCLPGEDDSVNLL